MITDEQFDREFDTFRFKETSYKPTKDIITFANIIAFSKLILKQKPQPQLQPKLKPQLKPQPKPQSKPEPKSKMCCESVPPRPSDFEYDSPATSKKSSCSMSILDDELDKQLKIREPNFYDFLIAYMKIKNVDNEADLYKKAEVDRKVFSKIRSMRKTNHRPSKPTAIKLCLALELTSEQTQEMLNTVGHGMSNASLVDKIILFFIAHKEFDIFRIDKKILDITNHRYLIDNL